MALEEFVLDGKGELISVDNSRTLKIGTEVLVINSHADGRYTSVGKYAGRLQESDIDVIAKLRGYDNIVLKDTFTLPVEVSTSTGTFKINDKYHTRILKTIKSKGTKEGKTSHALDLATSVYKVA